MGLRGGGGEGRVESHVLSALVPICTSQVECRFPPLPLFIPPILIKSLLGHAEDPCECPRVFPEHPTQARGPPFL